MVALVIGATYILFLIFQLGTHLDLFREEVFSSRRAVVRFLQWSNSESLNSIEGNEHDEEDGKVNVFLFI